MQASVNNKRVREYVQNFNLCNPQMSVVIQEFIEPEISGVWFGTNKDNGVLEYVTGNGEKLVSGKVTPKREVWDGKQKGSLKAGDTVIGQKLKQLQRVIIKDQKVLPDFEWCVVNDKLKMVQFRPATVELVKEEIEEKTDSKKEIIQGIACSGGECEGNAQFVRMPANIDEFQEGNILLAMFTDPEWILLMRKAGALVTAMGGFLCHTAIIARELGIPCVTGIGRDALLNLKDKRILVNGFKGEIELKS